MIDLIPIFSYVLGLASGTIVGAVIIIGIVGRKLGLKFFEPPDWKLLRITLAQKKARSESPREIAS